MSIFQYITPWFSEAAYTEVFYPQAGGLVPDQNNPFPGGVLKGEILEVLGVTDAAPGEQWVKFIRRNDEGAEAVLFMRRQVLWGGRKINTWFPHAVELQEPVDFFPDETPEYSGGWQGVVVVSVAAPIFKDRECTQALRQAVPGEVIPYDSESSGVIRSAYKAGGVWTKCYFKREHQLKEAILDGVLKEQFVLWDEQGRPASWDEVDIIGEDEPEPPDPDDLTGWEKFVAWLKDLWQRILDFFGLGE